MMRLMLRITHFFLPFFPRFAKMEIKETRKGGLSMAAKKIDLEEIAALTKALFHAHYAGDLDKWFSYLCPDSVYLGTGEPLLFGGDAIREHFKGFTGKAVNIIEEEYFPVSQGDSAAQVVKSSWKAWRDLSASSTISPSVTGS